jgi:hypothetical protein
MGVWHVSGIGINPGAITVPLTYIYLLLRASTKGEQEARKFFEISGEQIQKLKGAPEGLIIFTSKEVIAGEKQGEIQDKWFNTRRQSSVPNTIAKYLLKLLGELKGDDFSEFYGNKWIKEIYLVELHHDDFKDCFKKVGIALNALKAKEIWVNMIGGTNQINVALLTAGSFFATVARYYYVFQSNIKLLHPEMSKPDFKNLEKIVPEIVGKWYELPIFHLEVGTIIKELNEMFQYREKINLSEVENMLERHSFPTKWLPKLKGKLINIDGNAVSRGSMLGILTGMIKDIEESGVENFSKWKNWASKNKILYELTLNGKVERVVL